MKLGLTTALWGCLVFGAAQARAAAEHETEGPGFGIMVGGGIFAFGNGTARAATTNIGASYTARVMGGVNLPIVVELAYIGTAQNIHALGVEQGAMLVSNGVESALRVNLLPGRLQPYVAGGAAWKRYSVTNTLVNVSSLRNRDDLVEFPVGGGLGWRYQHLLVDARGDYRFATGADLFRGLDVGLGNWEASLRIGAEF